MPSQRGGGDVTPCPGGSGSGGIGGESGDVGDSLTAACHSCNFDALSCSFYIVLHVISLYVGT